MSIDVRRRRLLVAIADLADRPVRRRTSGRKRRRHHGRMMMPVERGEAEGVGQSHGTVSLMMRRRRRRRWRWRRLPRSVQNVSRLLVAVAITVVARLLPLIILPGFTFHLDAGLRGLGHLDFNPHTVVPVYAGLGLDRETNRRPRRGTRRAGVLVAATYAGLLHPREVHDDSTPRRRASYDHDGVIVLRIGDTVVGRRVLDEKIGCCRLAAKLRGQGEAGNTVVNERL